MFHHLGKGHLVARRRMEGHKAKVGGRGRRREWEGVGGRGRREGVGPDSHLPPRWWPWPVTPATWSPAAMIRPPR